MFIGHFAVGFAAKGAARRTSVTALLASALFLDILWPIFLWLGIERVEISPGDTAFTPLRFVNYPWSHSLVMALAWAIVLAGLYRMRTRYAIGALWVGMCVFSHWVLDWVSHRPDLPITPHGEARAGLGLWNSVFGTALTEITMFVLGLIVYLRTTRARGRAGHLSLWSLVIALAVLYVGTVRGTPPPSVGAIKVVSTLTLPVLLAWFIWIDRTRTLRSAA